MFGIGLFEITVIMIVGLLFIGPKRLPEVARQGGKFFVKLRRITNDVKSSVDQFVQEAETEVFTEERNKLEALIRKQISEDESAAKEAHTDAEDTYDSKAESFDPHASFHQEKDLRDLEEKKDAE